MICATFVIAVIAVSSNLSLFIPLSRNNMPSLLLETVDIVLDLGIDSSEMSVFEIL